MAMSEDPKTLFEGAVQRLDLGAANRLRQARRGALAGARPPRRMPWLPGLATAALLVLGLAWWLPRHSAAPAPTLATIPAAPAEAQADEAAVLAEDGEDAELYAWLAEAPVAAEQRL
jgi:hypothetical protein